MEYECRYRGWPCWVAAPEAQLRRELRNSYDDFAGVLAMLRRGVWVIGRKAVYRLADPGRPTVPDGPGREW